ncbi:MAG: MDR family MFS transporter [Methylocystis sp.]
MKADAQLAKPELFRVMAGLCLAMLLSALDQTIVVTALPTIGVELGDLKASPWIVTAYLVAATVVTPLYGKLADIHGGRIMLMIGIAVFILGSVACALAPNMVALAGARALQGMGGGGLISLAQTIIADLVSPRERGRYQTYFAAVFVTSSVAGPLLGGLFAHYLHWSLIFWINLPLGLLAFFFANTALKRLPTRRHPHKIDYLGAGLLALASGLLALALGARGASLGSILGPLALSGLFWALFVWRLRTAEEPFIPLSVLGNAVARNAALSGAFGLGAFIGLSVVMPIYFEGRLGFSSDGSGAAMIPMMVGTVVGATLSGRLMGRLIHYKTPAVIGLALSAAAALVLAWRLDELSLGSLIAWMTLASVGIGTMLPISTVCVQNSVELRNLGSATAVMQFTRQIGCALIAALFGALVLGGSASRTTGARAIEGLGASFHLVFIVAAACVGASLLFLVRMEEKPLRGSPPA